VGESDQPLWKELYTQALSESDRQKVTLLLLAAELAMIEHSRQRLNSPNMAKNAPSWPSQRRLWRLSDFANWVGLRQKFAPHARCLGMDFWFGVFRANRAMMESVQGCSPEDGPRKGRRTHPRGRRSDWSAFVAERTVAREWATSQELDWDK
jgi:hypothetical protein